MLKLFTVFSNHTNQFWMTVHILMLQAQVIAGWGGEVKKVNQSFCQSKSSNGQVGEKERRQDGCLGTLPPWAL